MISILLISVSAVCLWAVLGIATTLQKHIREAKASKIPYIIGPVSIYGGNFWTAAHPFFIKLAKLLLPWSKDTLWLKTMNPNHSWAFHRAIYDELKSDTFFLASTGHNYLSTTDASLITQITSRRTDFEKPVEAYTVIDMYGPSILTLDGPEWKRHRKIAAPAFSEKSNALVWEESLRQVEGLLDTWAKRDNNDQHEMRVDDTADDTALLTLHVISGAGFGVPQVWAGQDEAVLGKRTLPGFNTRQLSGGHAMSFVDALNTMLNSVLWMAIFPVWLLKWSPFELHKKVISGFREMGDYFVELADYKAAQIEKGESAQGGMDLMGPLVEATKNPPSSGNYLTKQEVTSNAWIFLFAGHETSANALHFSLLFLAINRVSQQHLHKDIDEIAMSRPPSQWTYASDMRPFYNSMVGAVHMEALRLMPPVTDIPKIVRTKPVVVQIEGREATVPANCFVHLDVVNTQRNPKYYPHKPSVINEGTDDLNDFIPERWLLDTWGASYQKSVNHDMNENRVEESDTTASFGAGSLYTPPKGSFIVFSDGARSCPGRKFAHVELTAALASMFSRYSVELDVSEWANDDEVAQMNDDEKRAVYAKAVREARNKIRASSQIMTLKMHGMKVPIRVVKRGLETFNCCIQKLDQGSNAAGL